MISSTSFQSFLDHLGVTAYEEYTLYGRSYTLVNKDGEKYVLHEEDLGITQPAEFAHIITIFSHDGVEGLEKFLTLRDAKKTPLYKVLNED